PRLTRRSCKCVSRHKRPPPRPGGSPPVIPRCTGLPVLALAPQIPVTPVTFATFNQEIAPCLRTHNPQQRPNASTCLSSRTTKTRAGRTRPAVDLTRFSGHITVTQRGVQNVEERQ